MRVENQPVIGDPWTKNWIIYFACTLPDEPGCGCPENDFVGEHRFKGTMEEAEAEAKRAQLEVYSGDLRWWMEPGEE